MPNCVGTLFFVFSESEFNLLSQSDIIMSSQLYLFLTRTVESHVYKCSDRLFMSTPISNVQVITNPAGMGSNGSIQLVSLLVPY